MTDLLLQVLPFPTQALSKRHNILAFHRAREAIAANIIDFYWIQFEFNLSDMLSKHWEHTKIFPMIQKLLITCGPITLIPRQATEETIQTTQINCVSTTQTFNIHPNHPNNLHLYTKRHSLSILHIILHTTY